MKLFLFTPSVFIQATIAPTGPPAVLFNMFVIRSGEIGFVMTPWLQDKVTNGLVDAGYDKQTAEDQAKFIASLGKNRSDPEDVEGNMMIAIAKSLELDTVYYVGGSGESADGVVYKLVREAIGELE